MKKANELRAWLHESVPALKKNPDRMTMYIPKGRIACRIGGLSFEWRYDLEITVEDYADHADTLVVPLLAWISTNQPDLLQNVESQTDVLRFEAEIVDHDRSDVRFTLPLTERVIVSQTAPGRFSANHCGEPDLPELGGVSPWRLFVKGDEIIT